MTIEVMREQQDMLNELCFELYANGLTTRQIESITENIYGKKLSKSAVSRITESLYEDMKAFRERPLEPIIPSSIWMPPTSKPNVRPSLAKRTMLCSA
ncbi:transposase [Brevundimonas vesicularis]|uniref:transposase n=1 Tax=Brevundimonas vesicularis TaxID=41276 RepID=UPI0034D227DE